MGVAEFYYLEGGLLFGFLVAAGLTVISLNRPEYRIARVCAYASAILFGSIAVVWGVVTPESFWIRFLAVGTAGFIAAGCLAEALRFITAREKEHIAAPTAAVVSTEAPSSPGRWSGQSFMNIDGVVDGLEIDRGRVEGFGTDFNVKGTLKNAKLRDFQSSAQQPAGAIGVFKADRIVIGRLGPAPPPKMGKIQPNWPINQTKNADGTFTEDVPITIDPGIKINLIVTVDGPGFIKYELHKNGTPVRMKPLNDKNYPSARMAENATDSYILRITKKNETDALQVGLTD